MKRAALLRHLRNNGCTLLCEGAKHSWSHHAAQNKRSAVPRHNEIDDSLARKICRDLGVPKIKLVFKYQPTLNARYDSPPD